MRYQKTEGVILRSVNFQDSGKILTIYTKENGLIPFIVKGARKAKSKFRGKTELFSHVFLIYTFKETREVQIITDIELLKYYDRLMVDLDKISLTGRIARILNNVLLEQKQVPGLFNELLKTLALIDTMPPSETELIYLIFLNAFLKLEGLGLDFDFCQNCGKKLTGSAFLNLKHSHIICPDCRTRSASYRLITPEMIRFLGNLHGNLTQNERYHPALLNDALKIIEICYQNHFNLKLI